MIVVSASMPKSGSAWYCNMTNDLLIAAGHQDAREVRKKYNLHSVTERTIFLTRLDGRTLKRLDRISEQGNTFVVKTHRGPSGTLRGLMAHGSFTATYIYRDLRDVIVSALEHGKSMRDRGEDRRLFGIGPYRSFGRLYTVAGATHWGRWLLVPRWRAWTRMKGVLATRYEDLVTDPIGELRRLAGFLRLDVEEGALRAILEKYDRAEARPGGRIHFNKGVVGRHREVLTPRQQELCLKRLGPSLEEMGYLPEES